MGSAGNVSCPLGILSLAGGERGDSMTGRGSWQSVTSQSGLDMHSSIRMAAPPHPQLSDPALQLPTLKI